MEARIVPNEAYQITNRIEMYFPTKYSKKQAFCELLKADLARCRCGMNMADGALNYPLAMLSNSEIKNDG